MSENIVRVILEKCRAIISENVGLDDGIRQLKKIMEADLIGSSVLFDILTTLDIECGPNSGSNLAFRKLLLAVINEVIPAEVLNLELNALEADDKATKSRIVKLRTKIYYKQVKFNLLHEENEGYAKLIAEILSTRIDSERITRVIERLIGQFNLDPNRVVDIILDCFEQLVSEREYFLNILRKFEINRDELRNILIAKYIFSENAGYTSTDLNRVASLLCQADLVDFRSLFAMISPTQEVIREEYATLCALVVQRALKAEVISTGSLVDTSNYAPAMTAGDSIYNGPEPSTSTPSTISFEVANQAQLAEDNKLANGVFDDPEVLQKNQKLGFICALLEHGAWEMARQLFNYFPEGYILGKSKRISAAIANIVGIAIDFFYRQQKYFQTREFANFKQHDSWKKITYPIEKVQNWTQLISIVQPFLDFLGPYVASRQEVAIKLIRLFALFFDDANAKSLPNFQALKNSIMSMIDGSLLPASSLLNSNFAYCEEIWLVIQRFPPEIRYRMYGRWKSVHTTLAPRPRYWDLTIQRGKVLGMTRYAMKRLSKETAKVVGRQMGKLCHTFPMVTLDYMLDKVQDFQNFISPVVDSMRFLTNLGFDVLSYVLIENLSNPQKDQFKTTDGAFSPWLISLSNFAAAIYRRYAIDFSGLLQYIVNQLKDGKNLDLIVLREIISNISGVESSTDLTQEHLEALCGGDYLRQEAGFSLTKLNRKAVSRLKEALLKNDIFESICILISQQKNFIIYKDSLEYPLKLVTHMLDQSQETFVQFFFFLRANLRADEYSKRIPSVSQLLTKYHMSIEAAMCLSRPIYLNRVNILYETSKKNLKEDGKKSEEFKSKLTDTNKNSLYKNAFENIINMLEEGLIKSFTDTFWMDITARLYATFWLLSVNDLSAPLSAYEREIEKCRKELSDAANHGNESTSKAKRNVKDEERWRVLEQKLTEEMRKQTEHCKRIKEILIDKKEVLFAVAQNRSSQMLRFLQTCIIPRAVFSEVDAVYCAKFVETLHVIRTGFFQTIVFFDKIFTDVTPILAGLTERETNCFGRFCAMCLELIHRWHSSPAIFKEECEGYPGCLTKIRKRESDEPSSASPFTYESYRTICFKWQMRLSRSLSYVLSSSNYVLIRNGLTFMTKILYSFPIVTQTVKMIEKNVTTLRDNEKGKRLDLNLLAASYLVQLAKRNVRIYETKEFYNQKTTKSTTISNSTTQANGAVATLVAEKPRTSSSSAKRRTTTNIKSASDSSNVRPNGDDLNNTSLTSNGSTSKRKAISTSFADVEESPVNSRKRHIETKSFVNGSGGDADDERHSSSKRKAREH